MRICIIVGPYFPVPPIRGGAVEKYVWEFAQELARRSHQVTLLSRSEIGMEDTEVNGSILIHRVRGFDQAPGKLRMLVLDLLYALRCSRALPAHDVLLVHDLLFPVIAPYLRSIKSMYVFLGRGPNSVMHLHRHTKAFVVPGPALADKVTRFVKTAESQVVVLPHPVNRGAYYARSTFSEPVSSFLYVGRIHPEKGLDVLIPAFADFAASRPDVRLTVLGPVAFRDGGAGSEYIEHLRSLGNGSIRFAGPVYDQEQLASIYRKADVFCYPSLAEDGETFGLSVLEAMSCGCIPLVSSLTCFQDYITDSENGFVFERAGSTEENCRHALERLWAHTNLRPIRSAAIKTAEEYTVDRIVDRFESLLMPSELTENESSRYLSSHSDV